MSAEQTILDYYEALRRGEPLYPYFAERDDVVKFGISERLTGYDAVAEGLREQTRTTDDWRVESLDLRVAEHGDVAWFSDDVRMAWRDTSDDETREFDSRWSGTFERVGSAGGDADGDDGGDGDGNEGDDADEWQFVGMHVSAPASVED